MPTAGERRSAADVLAKIKAKTERVSILLDPDLVDEHAALDRRLQSASDEQKHELAEQILELEQRIADEEVEFVFKGMGRTRWRKLLADYPPTDEQRARGAEFNTDTFPFEAMAECIVEPEMSADQLRQLNDMLSEVQFAQLWGACLSANIGSGVTRPESLAAHVILANGGGKSPLRSVSESVEAS